MNPISYYIYMMRYLVDLFY